MSDPAAYHEPVRTYRKLLEQVDDWYRSTKERFPERVPCSIGCRDCCLGLFEITPADAELLREGLSKTDARTRRDIERRARKIILGLRAAYPDLGETLDGYSPGEIDDLCELAGPVECPALGKKGECRLYEHRPLVCRLCGIPVVDKTGKTIDPDGCGKCTLRPKEAPRLDYAALRRKETAILKRLGPKQSEVTLLLPQALMSPEATAAGAAGPRRGGARRAAPPPS